LSGFVYKGGKLTLGDMAMIFQFLGSDKLLRRSRLFQELVKYIHSFPQPQLLLGESSVRSILTIEAVQENRNSAAHSTVFSMEKARKTRSWCYSLINMLASSKHIP
jgi:hypothetical protein